MKRKAVLTLTTLALAIVPSRAQINIVPPGSIVEGLTLEEWSAEWWQWVASIPCATHPLLDTNGSFAHVGQNGSVFFLGGGYTYGNEPLFITRRVTVSPDQYIFYPVINWANDNVGREQALSGGELREETFAWYGSVTQVWATVDGQEIEDLFSVQYTLNSPFFSYVLPLEDNLFTCFGFTNLTHVGENGEVSPAVSVGYWFMLEPLPPGSHVMHAIGAIGEPQNYYLDITYLIEVTPPPLNDPIEELKLSIQEAQLSHPGPQGLWASLEAAQASFDRGDAQAGINQVNAFQNKVRAMMGKQNPGLAEEWIEAAREIMRQAEAGR